MLTLDGTGCQARSVRALVVVDPGSDDDEHLAPGCRAFYRVGTDQSSVMATTSGIDKSGSRRPGRRDWQFCDVWETDGVRRRCRCQHTVLATPTPQIRCHLPSTTPRDRRYRAEAATVIDEDDLESSAPAAYADRAAVAGPTARPGSDCIDTCCTGTNVWQIRAALRDQPGDATPSNTPTLDVDEAMRLIGAQLDHLRASSPHRATVAKGDSCSWA